MADIKVGRNQTDKENEMKKQYRQGDVFIVEHIIPKTAKLIKPEKRIVLEEGEVTGHAHAIVEPKEADLFLDGTRKFLEICLTAHLSHEEHLPITLPKGTYEVRRQVTWSALEQMARVVAD
jgi:hypothetical protein